jgi:hypothetical protein
MSKSHPRTAPEFFPPTKETRHHARHKAENTQAIDLRGGAKDPVNSGKKSYRPEKPY